MTINELIKNNIQMPNSTYGDILLNERNNDLTRILNNDEKEQYAQIQQADKNRLYINENMIEQAQKETPTTRTRKISNKPQTVVIPGIGEVMQIM